MQKLQFLTTRVVRIRVCKIDQVMWPNRLFILLIMPTRLVFFFFFSIDNVGHLGLFLSYMLNWCYLAN